MSNSDSLAARRLALLAGVALFAPFVSGFDPAQQDDSQAIVRHFVVPADEATAVPFESGQFVPREGEAIYLIGGTTMSEVAEDGWLEAALQRSFPEHRLRVRNLAWAADTVYRQQRPMFFFTEQGDGAKGSVPDQRDRLEPGIFMLQFGAMESLDGRERIDDFAAAYDSLLVELKKFSPRIVLLAPTRFAETGPAAQLASERNAILDAYVLRVGQLAERHGLIFIDVRNGADSDPGTRSRNGIHLTTEGLRDHQRRIAEALDLVDAMQGAEAETELIETIRSRNQLWRQYYRPTNWAFLFGDRQHVPSSRGHENSERRWFIEEIKRLEGLISAADSEIWRAAQ